MFIDKLARFLALLFFQVFGVRRPLVQKNLDLAFGNTKSAEEKQRIGFLSYYHFILTILEFLEERSGRLAKGVSYVGEHHLREALQAGQGVYVLCCHMGSWEAMAAGMSQHIAPTHVLVKKVGSSFIDGLISKQRIKNGFHPVLRKKKGDGMKAIFEILNKGEILGFVMDQARPGEPFLPFFGKAAKTNTSLAAIWRRRPAPIVPAFIKRTGVHEHTITVLPALTLTLTDDHPGDVLAHSQIFNEVVEQMIRQAPEQYFWVHDRWKGGNL